VEIPNEMSEVPMNSTNSHESRRELLRGLMTGVAAAVVAMIDTDIGAGQGIKPRRPLAAKLLASKYLPEAYTQAAAALLQFDNLTAADRPDAARAALTKAAAVICDALAKLSSDAQFWATLGDQRELIGKNAPEIKRLLSNLDEFLPQEEKALQAYMPAGPRMRLVSDLSLALSRFREEPTNWNLENLRSRVRDSQNAVCAAAKTRANEPPSDLFSDIRIFCHGLGVIGGGALIVVNAVATPELPVALTSMVGGVRTIIGESTGLIEEIKARKRPRLM
jgi:hypothetical protein